MKWSRFQCHGSKTLLKLSAIWGDNLQFTIYICNTSSKVQVDLMLPTMFETV